MWHGFKLGFGMHNAKNNVNQWFLKLHKLRLTQIITVELTPDDIDWVYGGNQTIQISWNFNLGRSRVTLNY
jgi:hypothetical protein